MAVGATTTSPSQAKSVDLVAPITIKVGGQALDATTMAALEEATVKQVRVLPDMAFVRFHDPTAEISRRFKLDADLEILIGTPKSRQAKPLFKGLVATLEPEFRDDGQYFGLRAYDAAHKMTRTKRTRVFQDQTISDIVHSVFSDHGLAATVADTGGPLEYMMQSNESDWDFVWRLANLIGFEVASDGSKVKFRKIGDNDGPGPTLVYASSQDGVLLYSFRPRFNAANHPRSITATYVNRQGQRAQVTVPVSGAISTLEGAEAEVKRHGMPAGAGTLAVTDVVAPSATEVRRKLVAIRDAMLAAMVEAEGVAEGHPDIKPGLQCEVVGVAPFDGKYLISEVVHTYRGSTGYRSRFHVAARTRNLLEAVSPKATAPARAPDYSLVQATVTNVNDPENLGRVRIAFPTMAETSDPEGWWARIATSSAGKERGLLMLPQVGDKVLAGFENGDNRKPFVLGSVFDGKGKPGEDIVKSDGSFAVKSDKSLFMKAKDNFEFHTDKAWKGKAEKAITFENSMDTFMLKSGKEIVIKAPTIKLEADMKIEMKGKQIAINGDIALELKAPNITVGGGMVKLG